MKFLRALPIYLLSFMLAVPAVHAETFEIGPGDDIRAVIGNLNPGDELVLREGVYNFNSSFNIGVVGEPDRHIVIRARTGDDVLISMNTDTQNVLEVQDSAYLELRNLRFTGGSHGIRLMNSDYITIESCEIFETGDVAISANSGGTYEGIVIRGNHIHHTNGYGEGMYLGCNNDECRIRNSLIEWNYIHHTNRSSVEQGDGIELKEGSSGNIVRHNVIHDTNYPGILTYSTVGNGPPNIIEANLIWNSNDNGIQSAADSIIRNNIVLGSGIVLQPHQSGSPSNVEVVHNTVVLSDSGIEVQGATGTVVIANNAVYSSSGSAINVYGTATATVILAGNVGSGGLSGSAGGYVEGNGIDVDFVNANYGGAPPIDLFPSDASALRGAAAASYVTDYDFNGDPRVGTADAGAYRYSAGGNPGWALAPEFKARFGLSVAPLPPRNLTSE